MDPTTPIQPAQQPSTPPPQQLPAQPLNDVANKKSMYLIIGIVVLVLILVVLSFVLILRNST